MKHSLLLTIIFILFETRVIGNPLSNQIEFKTTNDDADSIEIPVRTSGDEHDLKAIYTHLFEEPKRTFLNLVHDVLEVFRLGTENDLKRARDKARQRDLDIASLFPDIFKKN